MPYYHNILTKFTTHAVSSPVAEQARVNME